MTVIDLSPALSGQIKVSVLAQRASIDDLRETTHAQIDELCGLIGNLSDEQIVFVAKDPEREDGIGWNVAHLLAHVTATTEESACVSSILARGISLAFEPRLRLEKDWTKLASTEACIRRLNECRRIALAYLDAWPAEPRLDTLWEMRPALIERVGPINATGAYLMGLYHQVGQFSQLREIVRQANKATSRTAG